MFCIFPSQETGTDTLSLSHVKFQQLFTFFLPFGQSSKRLSADHLRHEHRGFYMVTSIGLVPYILADLALQGKLLTKHKNFLMQPSAWFARITFTKLHKPILACHNLICKPPQNAHVCETLGYFQTVHLQANSGQSDSEKWKTRLRLEHSASATRGCKGT